jgi:hypothetical protein
MPGKERGVDVERRDPRDSEDLFVEDLSIARDHEDVGRELSERGGELAVPRGLGLQDQEPALVCERRDFATLNRATAAARPIRASHNTDEVMGALKERSKDGGAKGR